MTSAARRPRQRGLAADHVRDRRRARPVRARAAAPARLARLAAGARRQRRLGPGAARRLRRAAQRAALYREQLGELHPEIQHFVADLADTAARRWSETRLRACGRCAASRATTCPRRSCAGRRSTARSSSRRSSASTRRRPSGPPSATASARRSSTQGWSEKRQAFAQSFDSDDLDAAQLLMPLVGFLPATDPRMRSTIEAIAGDLTEDGLVLRYRNERGPERRRPDGRGGHVRDLLVLARLVPGAGRRDRARRGDVRPARRLRERPRPARRGDRHRAAASCSATSRRRSATSA